MAVIGISTLTGDAVAAARPRRAGLESVLVLGADNGLGTHAVRSLLDKGLQVRVADVGTSIELGEAAAAELIDCSHPALLRDAVRSHDVVCDLAPVIDEPRSRLGHAIRAIERRLLRELRAALADALSAAPSVRLVQRSTAALYADGGDRWIDEDWRLQPNAATQDAAAAERTAEEHRRHGGGAVVLRLAHPYGAGDSWSRRVATLARRGWLPFEGPPDAYFPLVRLDDAALAIVAALHAPPGTYNVASPDAYTNDELNALFRRRAGKRLEPLFPAIRPADRELLERSHRLDSSALVRAADWQPGPVFDPSAEQ